jgi:vesicle-associated membrane protein 4
MLKIFRSEPYDPYVPNSASSASKDNKTQRVQKQVDEVVNIMQDNIDKAMQRGERLDDLRGKTGNNNNIK